MCNPEFPRTIDYQIDGVRQTLTVWGETIVQAEAFALLVYDHLALSANIKFETPRPSEEIVRRGAERLAAL